MIQSKPRNLHSLHQTLRCCLCNSHNKANQKANQEMDNEQKKLRLVEDKNTKYILFGPPSWLTASMNLWWSSHVHFNLGLASVDNTRLIFVFWLLPLIVLLSINKHIQISPSSIQLRTTPININKTKGLFTYLFSKIVGFGCKDMEIYMYI